MNIYLFFISPLSLYSQTTLVFQEDWQLIFTASETFNRQAHKKLFKAWSGIRKDLQLII